MDHPREVTDQLDFKCIIGGGPKRHLIDQRTDDLDRLGARCVAFEQVMEGRDLSAVQGSKVGVEPHRLVFQAGEFPCQFSFLNNPAPLWACAYPERGIASGLFHFVVAGKTMPVFGNSIPFPFHGTFLWAQRGAGPRSHCPNLILQLS
jgi:hypothetical protein